ncbi:MAG: UvrD-helicase domain-containing protein [Candidatus Heimdallarchaeota archaeon]|nr:UvrD-helicase domain-containing protein [Candidatus Heimdallarchaeota archaeon]
MNYLDGLNVKQKEAALHDKGPILVIAGAGTGKTKVLTSRIANLIDTEKANPYEILAITFTNKAAKEMKTRISALLHTEVDRMWVGTFHSICVRILRKYISVLGYNNNFTIYDTTDQKNLIKKVIKEMAVDPKRFPPNQIKSNISRLKNAEISPDEYISKNYSIYDRRTIGEIYGKYEKELRRNNALDFDDLLIKALDCLRKDDSIAAYYREKFKYILVDEYQDTNNIQYQLVKYLAKRKNAPSNLFVVGDDDQSIYGWRGADIGNILNFEKDFENSKLIRLERNYRSTSTILDAANAVIKNNVNRKGKELYTEDNKGNLITIMKNNNEKEEAYNIAHVISHETNKSDVDYSDFAILYRTNSQSRALEEGLIKLGIPYKIVGGLKFYGRKEIKDIMAYIILLQNPTDDINFLRVINTPTRKIGLKSVASIQQYADENSCSLFEACYNLDDIQLPKAAHNGVSDFVKIVELLMVKKDACEITELINAVYEDTGLKKMFEADETIEGLSRIDNIEEFFSAVTDFEEMNADHSLDSFLTHVSLLSDIDRTKEVDIDVVTLLTIHSAKGLEFSTVFIAGLEDGLFPSIRSSDEDNQDDKLEEERRLFYVATTRAKKNLYLSYAEDRMTFGRHTPGIKSRYLDEIPSEYLDNSLEEEKSNSNPWTGKSHFTSSLKTSYSKPTYSKIAYSKNNCTKAKVKDTFTRDENISLTVGDKVLHKAWGEGTIVSLNGEGEKQKATIAFNNKGIKTLITALAPIKKI